MPEININELEKNIRELWEKNKTYKFNANSKAKIYSIDTPPPTVSGAMHIGHAFSYAQEDFIARYKRMKGFNVFYPFGTDDN
ncbi:MAG: class I tRNA ligase family protein, partial [Nanoarchaeota archaeon]